jgi:hypothetical protein
MNRRDLLKGIVGTTLVSATAKAGDLILPGKREIEVISVDPVISNRPPFSILSWEISIDNSVEFMPRPVLGMMRETLRIEFGIHSNQMFYMTEKCGKDAFFTWELPIKRFGSPIDNHDWDYVRVNGVTQSLEINQVPGSFAFGRLTAAVISKS